MNYRQRNFKRTKMGKYLKGRDRTERAPRVQYINLHTTAYSGIIDTRKASTAQR